MRDMGVDAYRFSLSWPRILPRRRGATNEAGLAFYDRLIDALPFLAAAKDVTIVEIPEEGIHRADALSHVEDVAAWLLGHGIAASTIVPEAKREITGQLNKIAANVSAGVGDCRRLSLPTAGVCPMRPATTSSSKGVLKPVSTQIRKIERQRGSLRGALGVHALELSFVSAQGARNLRARDRIGSRN